MRRGLPRAVFIVAVICLAAAVVIATGLAGHVALGPDESKDSALVISLVCHATLGIAIAFIQCAIGITLGRLLFRRKDLPAAQALLLGLPASLVFLALAAAAALAAPAGGWLALICVVLLLAPLRAEVRSRAQLHSLMRQVAAVGFAAAVFGVWLGLLWHGPTATLPGWPSGDEVFYSSLPSG